MTGLNEMGLLRFTTAGSVDDGKSTLIGRLLYDTKSIFEDQLQAIEETSSKKGKEYVDLSLLTDGLRDERAQGITIDVAYRYFATPKRKFIIADTPGHIQYTRNMVTGASTADLAIILIDARKGVIEQTYRHSIITNLLNIKHIVVCINKMDLVEYKEEVYNEIKTAYLDFYNKLKKDREIKFIPISALEGDNVVTPSEKMPWYKDGTLIDILEGVDLEQEDDIQALRFPVQYVLRPHSKQFHDYRAYAGRVESGGMSIGQEVTILPSGIKSKIKSINLGNNEVDAATNKMSVSVSLTDDIDVSRGDMIVGNDHLPNTENQELELMVSWFNEKGLVPNNKYIVKHTSNQVKCIIKKIGYKLNVNSLDEIHGANSLEMNDIGKISIKPSSVLYYDAYKKNRNTGSVIFIDEFTNETVGAGMII